MTAHLLEHAAIARDLSPKSPLPLLTDAFDLNALELLDDAMDA